jgi:(p)ppGpp synthase/HD superfamily hydrolase
MSTLQRAIEIATLAHQGQVDKSGSDYIGHPLRVMEMGRSEDERIVGVLHDVVEDTGWTFEALQAEGFSQKVIDALRCVTKLSEKENYDEFIERVRKNPLAVAVKINDLTDNMDIRRLPYLSDKDVKRLKKYLKAYKQLTGTPTYSVYACRQEFPNAYEPWSEDDDWTLTKMWCGGVAVKELADHFQRKPGAILSRIKKLELEEKYGKR